MQFGIDGKSINIDIHCSDKKPSLNPFASRDENGTNACLDEVHKLRESALYWLNANGAKTKKVIETNESEKVGELRHDAQSVLEHYEHVYSTSRDKFMDFLKSQREKQEPFEQRVQDFKHEIQDLFRK